MSELKSTLQAAQNLLARRDHSAGELNRKLRAKGFSEEDIATTVSHLQDKNLLSDEQFISNYLNYRRGRGNGPLKIKAELLSRGVALDQIEKHLNLDDAQWIEDARRAWQKRFKNRLPTDTKSRAQQLRFLYQRGFTSDQINSIFD